MILWPIAHQCTFDSDELSVIWNNSAKVHICNGKDVFVGEM